MTPVIAAVNVGGLAALGPRGAASGIHKRPVAGAVRVGRDGLSGDAQGDRRHHGGPEKAVHHYARDHYSSWCAELGDVPALAAAAPFGENISAAGLTEADVAVGDVFRVGTALLQVSQGRQPCWRLNARFDVVDMARRVQNSGRTGWYYRVIEEGEIQAGDQLDLIDRVSPDWTVARLWRALYIDLLDADELHGMAALTSLAEVWRAHAVRRLATGMVEDWARRLEGDA